MPDLKFRKISEEREDVRADTPIGNYVAYCLNDPDQPQLWSVELWGGPDKQAHHVGHAHGKYAAMDAAQRNYTRIYQEMGHNA